MTQYPLKSILLVDDDEISNLFNKIFINKLNLDVEIQEALNGREAFTILSSDNPNPIKTPCLLLLDVKMPIMDGWEFLGQYEKEVDNETRDQIVVIMLTTSEDQADLIRAMKNPLISKFLQKPLSERKITEIIKKYFKDVSAM
ncbi:MAG: response regulator [Flavobacteriaceae bacterium]